LKWIESNYLQNLITIGTTKQQQPCNYDSTTNVDTRKWSLSESLPPPAPFDHISLISLNYIEI